MNFDLQKAIPVLRSTPRVLRGMLAQLDSEWVHGNYGEKTFSPFDVLGPWREYLSILPKADR